jgi:hypothetical protein
VQSGLAIGPAWPDDARHDTKLGPLVLPAVSCIQITMTYGIEQGVVTMDAALATGLTTAPELSGWLARTAGHRMLAGSARSAFGQRL